MEKYKELYEHAKFAYQEELNRYNEIETKAARFLSVWTILLGAVPFIYKWTVEPVTDSFRSELDILVVFFFLVSVCSIFIAWVFCFVVLKLWTVKQSPLDERIVDLFDRHESQKIYKTLTDTYKTAYQVNKQVTDRKAEYLELAYIFIFIAIMLLAIWFALSVYKSLYN